MNNPASYARLGALALMWGSSFLLIKVALAALSPTQIAVARTSLGAGVLLLLCVVRRHPLRWSRRLGLHVAVAGLFASALPWVLFGLGERSVDSGLTGVLNGTTPLWTVLIGWLAGTEKALTPARITGLALGFGGVLLILAPWQGGHELGWGTAACLAAAASYGVGYVYIGRHLASATLREQGLSPVALAAMQMTAAAGIALLSLPLDGLHPVSPAPLPLVAVSVLGVACTGIAFAWNYRLISDEGATTAATVAYLMPAVSVLDGWLILNERLGPRELLGMVIVLLGVALIRQKPGSTGSRRIRGSGDDGSAFLPAGSRILAAMVRSNPMK